MSEEASARASSSQSWQRWRRPGPTRKQLRIDVWLALGVLVGTAGTTVLVNSMGAFVFGEAPSLPEQLLWGLALSVPLAVRRRFPLVVLIVVGALFIGAQARHVGDNFMPSVVLFLAIYTIGAWHRNRTVARWARIGVIVAMFCWLASSLARSLASSAPQFPQASGPLDPILASVSYSIVFNLLFFLSAYFFGNTSWVSARRRAELAQQAQELRLSQQRNTRDAVVAERVRIARDLHDVVAHHVSVMGIQASAGRSVLDTDHASARSSLEDIEQTARTAVGELHGLLDVLRSEQPDPEILGAGADHATPRKEGPAAAPRIDQLPALITMARSAGLTVDYSVHGEPRAVPDGVALSVYRVVQEALTNVVKHAAARTVDVRVRYRENSVEVEITDDGRGSVVAARDGAHDGFGLVGMRERVAVYDGEFESGPRAAGGYRVRATFPTAGSHASGDDTKATMP